jgi:hypothetical protein
MTTDGNISCQAACERRENVLITGVHASFNVPDPAAVRTFLKDVLELPSTDIGGGFLVFEAPDVEIAATDAAEISHDISFSCADIGATMETLRGRGVSFDEPVDEEVWGWRTYFRMPGGVRVMLYQPKYRRNPQS